MLPNYAYHVGCATAAQFDFARVQNLVKLEAFMKLFLDQVDEFFSDVGLELQDVWWVEPEDIALTVPFPVAILLGGLVLEGCIVPVFQKRQFVIIFGFVEFLFVARQGQIFFC